MTQTEAETEALRETQTQRQSKPEALTPVVLSGVGFQPLLTSPETGHGQVSELAAPVAVHHNIGRLETSMHSDRGALNVRHALSTRMCTAVTVRVRHILSTHRCTTVPVRVRHILSTHRCTAVTVRVRHTLLSHRCTTVTVRVRHTVITQVYNCHCEGTSYRHHTGVQPLL